MQRSKATRSSASETGGVGVSLTEPEAVACGHPEILNGLQQLLREPVLRLELVRDDDGVRQSAANLLDLFQDGDRDLRALLRLSEIIFFSAWIFDSFATNHTVGQN